MAKNFGKTWWGEQWLNSLSNIDYSNRLPRGSSYANKGAVESINIKENHIKAKVSGSRKSPYKVDIILPPFFDPELSLFLKKISEKPMIISKLLNRELDPLALELAENAGLKVFPSQWSDLKMQCSCPDWAVPCKHLAAVIYKVSSEIDNNPFLAFELHRVDLIEELNKIGVFVKKEENEIPTLKDVLLQQKSESTVYIQDYAYKKLAFSTLQDIHFPLLSLLVDYPVFYPNSANFKVQYQSELNKVVKNAKRIVAGKIKLNELIDDQSNNNPIVNIRSSESISIDELYIPTVYINNEGVLTKDFLLQLSEVPANQISNYKPSTAVLHSVLQFSIHLLSHGAVIPQIISTSKKTYIVRWLPAVLSKDVRRILNQLEGMLPPEIFHFINGKKQHVINKDVAVNLLSVVITELMSILSSPNKKDVFIRLFFDQSPLLFNQPGEEALPGGVANWLQKYFISQKNFKPHISIIEAKNNTFNLEIGVQDTKLNNSEIVPLNEVLVSKSYENIRFEILKSLSLFSTFIPGIELYVETNAEKPLNLENDDFANFLMQIIPAIQLLDIEVLLPKALQEILKPKTTVKLKANKQNKSFIRLDEMLSFDWHIALGDSVVSWEEFQALLKKSKNLIKYKSNYIYVDDGDVQKLVKHFDKNPQLNSFEILRAALSGEYLGAAIEITDEVLAIIEELNKVTNIPLPKAIKAQLRPYQQRGYSWMYRNAKLGFGSVIADDMGLGKTLQVICLLQKYKEEKLFENSKALVIVPTGLLYNWQSEIQKFAPKLKSFIYHGTTRNIDNINESDIVLTSYGIVRSDPTIFKKKKWCTLIIDEAQNIKNNSTAQSKAVKSIAADNFIAMSGTPVENRLSELWSIMDFCNRGFLGNSKEFNDTFGIPIENYNDKEIADKLQKVSSPFLMRRLKTDKSIISDLPDKIEMNSYATLTKEQASLYEETLKKALADIEEITTLDSKALFVRQGLVLQMIMALKQICNHPTQFLKNNQYDASLSGKMEMLFSMLDSILEANEKVLIFTQFKEMGSLLQRFIAERYREEPLFYHGGSTLKQRNTMVENFQTNRADKIFILSLKAAGTGLNLTAAQHVIHYDLWWNPAVEAQATDRAYRIGQKNNVMVQRFITKNTFEEQINDMIQSKKALAEMTVATGENWIGNLNNQELKEIFSLR